ncbi:MAG: hypothetical protein JSV51_10155 [Candidatus Bathyarchaeota archaeon]|nr:MAG: hypothetical protein JSV51_10155 [Candidatus Bathyarchaeota archaeon]
MLSYDRGDSSTRIIVLALEANTNVTLDTDWDEIPEFSWNSGVSRYNSTIFYGDDNSIPPGTHIHGDKPIIVVQQHGIEPSPWTDSGALALLPYELWDTQYLAPNYATGKIEVTAPTPGTNVYLDTDNDGTPEYTWTSNATERHHLWGTNVTEYFASNITATNPIEVATVHAVYDGNQGTPSFARLSLPRRFLGNEFYTLQQFPSFPGDGIEWIGISSPYLPCTVKIQPDVEVDDIREFNITSYVDSSEHVRDQRVENYAPIINMVSYLNSTAPAEAYYTTYAKYFVSRIDVEAAATSIPVNHWGTDYLVLGDPADTELVNYTRLISVIAPVEGTHVMIDVDHDGLAEYEWTSTASNFNATFSNLPSGTHIHGSKPFTAQQLVYKNDFRDARAIELLPIPEINRDVAITAVTPAKTIVAQGLTFPINVTAWNFGNYTEIFDTALNAINLSEIGIGVEKTSLDNNSFEVITFSWNTSDVPYGNYLLVANADAYDYYPSDNINTSRWIFITILGDIDGDTIVDISDLTRTIVAYGKTRGSQGWLDNIWYANRDVNGDDIIDFSDIAIVIDQFGESW